MADEREVNPYESPRAPLDDDRADDAVGLAWRERNTACIHNGGEFPRRCVHCATADNAVRIPYRQIWIGVGSGVFRHRTAYWICRRHRGRQGLRKIAEAVMFAPVIIVILAADELVSNPRELLAVIAAAYVAAKLFPLLLKRWTGTRVELSSKNGRVLELTGCGEAFLDSLPTREELELAREPPSIAPTQTPTPTA